MTKRIDLPAPREEWLALRAGDEVLLSGTIYTARDAAHKRICQLLEEGAELPFDLKEAVIYYAGPCPTMPGHAIGSCGPTTSGRMDKYAPMLYAAGAAGAIGKGQIGQNVVEAMKEHGGVYFAAVGGAGALIAHCVTEAAEVGFHDLGPESVKRLTVREFPVIVAVDSACGSLFG